MTAYVPDPAGDPHVRQWTETEGKVSRRVRGRPRKVKIDWKSIRALFSDKTVVTFEELTPFMGKNSEEFWGTKDKGMFRFLLEHNFEIIGYKDKDDLINEIYVNFESYRTDFEQTTPTVYVSAKTQKSLSFDVSLLKEKIVALATELGKAEVTIHKTRDSDIQITLLGKLHLDDKTLRGKVLEKLSKEHDYRFLEEEV